MLDVNDCSYAKQFVVALRRLQLQPAVVTTGLSQGSLNRGVGLPNRTQHPLRRSRRVHLHRQRITTRCRHRIPQRLPHTHRQHQRWLAYGFAAEHVVFTVGLGPQGYVEVFGHIARSGDFVGAGGVGA